MSPQKISILIIEDERPWAKFLEEFLAGLGYACRTAVTGREGIETFRQSPTDVVLTDLRMPDIDGMEVTRSIKTHDPDTIVIMMTGYATSEAAVQAFECGATDYITKPFNANQIHMVVTRVLEHRRLSEENDRLRHLIETRCCFDQIVGGAPSMQAIYKLIEQVAPSDTSVHISGEPGTGKMLVAEAIHRVSERPDTKIEELDCAALAPENLEVALLGAEGAGDGFASLGVLERAAEGTTVLRCVESLPPAAQDRLHEALQDHQIRRVGGGKPVPLRTRLITTSNVSLLEAAESGAFRRDLFYRLGVVSITVPPLSERREDISLLANFFVEQSSRHFDKRVERITYEALMALSSYAWPRNVAELREVIHQAVAVNHTGVIRIADLPSAIQREVEFSDRAVSAANVPLREAKRRFEREYFRDLLRRTKGNMSLASRSSRVGRPYLYKKISDHNLDPNEFR